MEILVVVVVFLSILAFEGTLDSYVLALLAGQVLQALMQHNF